MFKRIRKKLMSKLYHCNPALHSVLAANFHKKPLKYSALALYLLPVRRLVRPDELFSQRTFNVSKDYLTELHSLLHIAKVKGHELVRIGDAAGYTMLDDFKAGGAAYSFGLGGDVSWDKDMAGRGYDVFMYDHTIDSLPDKDARFHWFRQGIADGRSNDDRLKTLEYFIRQNRHEGNRDMILKMDVEGAEWGFLSQVSSEMLSQFRQITFELHGLMNGKMPFEQVLGMLRKLNETHQLIHLHPCNYNMSYVEWGNKRWFNVIEASYASREAYSFEGDYDVVLPLKIDRPCSDGWPEPALGHWNDPIEYGDMMTSVIGMIPSSL